MQTARSNNPEGGPSTEDRSSFKVYKPCNTSVPIPAIPDDYYNPTMADLRNAQAALTARSQGLVNTPLQTRAMRLSAEKIRKERWPSTTIRIRFPDRTQLEKVFPSSDKIKSVYAFVRGCLNDEAKPVKFILYQAPPRRDLRVSDLKVRDLSLSELQLAPSSVLLLRFESEQLNSTSMVAPLAPSILLQAVDLPVPPTYEIPTLESQGQKLSEVDQGKAKALPKWFKLGKKN